MRGFHKGFQAKGCLGLLIVKIYPVAIYIWVVLLAKSKIGIGVQDLGCKI